MKRFTFTEEDAAYQWEKLRSAYMLAEWSEEYFNNRALLSDYYLKERLTDEQITPEWREHVKPMREELCEKLELFKPRQETWRDRHLAGVEAPLLRLIARYKAEVNLRMAAYENCKTLVERLGLSKYTIHMLRRNAHKELNKVYGCPA